MTEPNQQLIEAVARLAERLWRVHPREVMDTGLTRQQFYEREIGDLVAAAIQATDGECQRLRSALEKADEVLRDYACHGGPGVPCLRSPEQCRQECGRDAGDALLVVEAAIKEQSA